MKNVFTVLLAIVVTVVLASCSTYTCPTYAKQPPAQAKVKV
ncbi:hypothetical protein [Chryseosolibacter histidini]|nr:hypothetical protein [Chryseosolibacter histidini]